MRPRVAGSLVAVLLALGASPASGIESAAPAVTPPACSPAGAPVELSGSAVQGDAKTYRVLPVEVAAGTTRIEVGYSWADVSPLPSTPLTQSVLDLGLWDADGYRSVDGFRGWSGSRQGKVADGQDPVFVQADVAERGYRPGSIEAGTWWVELGVAAVAPGGLTYEVVVTCSAPATGPAPDADPVDPSHVADPDPDWYAGDFHMHGFHSSPSAPPFDDGDPSDVDSFVDFARAAGLDFLPITDYVTTQHHDELGSVQRANPDLLVWPGREIITYYGHATTFGESPSVVDYRHGFEDVTLGAIQAATLEDGALFGVAHPTIFPGPLFQNFCRGCEFTLGSDIDWGLVDTIEVLTGGILVDDTALGGPGVGVQIQNPFVESAIDLWEARLLAGDRITAVSGSDDKAGPDLGATATQVFAEELSRPALIEAVRSGRAYVQARGVADSPMLDLVASDPEGNTVGMGDTLDSDRATIDVTIRGGDGQFLRITRDGDIVGLVPIASDDFTHRIDASTVEGSGPLGTFWRVDTLDAQSLTTIANPVFLLPTGRADEPSPSGSAAPPASSPSAPADLPVPDADRRLPATGGPSLAVVTLLAIVAALASVRVAKREGRSTR
ncbi:MAG: CehA/McbA family metallohydrolase [Acidimicrobiales bacterium]|nr:CehA/McbA family metallohydrolase [Acidimicrobiales bacterium]